MFGNNNLISFLEPKTYKYRKGHNHSPIIRTHKGRMYYTVLRRCKLDDTHRPASVKVFEDTFGPDGVKEVFDGVSNHCMECGAISYKELMCAY